MIPRIQCRHLLRLAQRQGAGFVRPAGYVQTTQPSMIVPQCRPLSTSPIRRQEPRHPPVPEPAAVDPIPPATTATTTPPPPPPPPPATEPSPSAQQQEQQQQQPRKRRLAPRLLLAITFTLVGLAGGSSLRLLLTPPPPPEPHTDEDAYTIRVLHDQAARLPIVQQLSADPDAWESWDAYDSLSAEQRAQHITAGALAGSRGVGGYQRVFWNKATGELLSVIYFGGAATGWPGVVHGGCLATILDESCGRAAFKEWGGRAGLTASLGLEYKRPTLANGFYVVRVRVRPEEELPEKERGKRHYKCWVDANIEDAVTGAVTVVAEALFVGGQGKNGEKGTRFGGKVSDAHARF